MTQQVDMLEIPQRARLSIFFYGIWFFVAAAIGPLANCLSADEPRTVYRTPYSVKFSTPREQLVADLEHGERGDRHLEAEIPHAEWYSPKTRDRWKSWGPPAHSYRPPADLDKRSLTWKRERVIAAAMRYAGYGYQHHHVPDWNPPADWPWKETAVGHNGKGVDCSNFTAFVYNQGFGIRLASDVHQQAKLRHAEIVADRREIPLRRIELPAGYQERIKVLRTGDLLFIRKARQDQISHVVLWVGAVGVSPDHVPLIIDSHGETIKDSRSESIPPGVHLRPYRENSWYHRSASHVLRVFDDAP